METPLFTGNGAETSPGRAMGKPSTTPSKAGGALGTICWRKSPAPPGRCGGCSVFSERGVRWERQAKMGQPRCTPSLSAAGWELNCVYTFLRAQGPSVWVSVSSSPRQATNHLLLPTSFQPRSSWLQPLPVQGGTAIPSVAATNQPHEAGELQAGWAGNSHPSGWKPTV